jgi:putative thiamine transport system permease protein
MLGAVVAVPLLGVVASVLAAGCDAAAWQALARAPQLPRALAMTLWTGLAATLLAITCSAVLLSHSFPGPRWAGTVKLLPSLLAVPHAAFAIGFAFLIAPSGWLLRALSPWATGWGVPPPWPTTQDPWGLGLIAVLVAKEVPFLLWAAASQLQRADVAQRYTREHAVALSLGYSPQQAWWRVLWPQLWPRLTGPALAVLAYSVTVVDMALVIGPTSPPTLAVLAWEWLLDADVAVNAQGAAAGWLLAGVVASLAGGAAVTLAFSRRCENGLQGPQTPRSPQTFFRRLGPVPGVRVWWMGLAGLYGAVLVGLAVGSVAGVWVFPHGWPQTVSLQAWASVASSTSTLTTTLWLGVASSSAALLWAVAWLESAPPLWDQHLRRWVYLPLLLPGVLWVVGLHRLSLAWGLDAQWLGLWVAHTLAALPYVLMALSPAYLRFDQRYGQIAASLRKSQVAYLWQVKWPLLKAALTSAFAVGFAVSVAQYLPTLFIGAGRFATVTTEAVTLAGGAQRSLVAAYAGLQGLLPALVFGLAAWLGRARQFEKRANMAPATKALP